MKIFCLWASFTLALPMVAWSLPSQHGLSDQGEHAHHEPTHAHTDHDDHDNHQSHGDHEPHTVALNSERAAAVGVTHAKAAPRSLVHEKTLYGQLTLLPDGLTHVRARFDGVVKEVLVATGEHVVKGQPLAVVESNESLKNFRVLAPQAGQVHSLQVTEGELTREGPLLTLINAKPCGRSYKYSRRRWAISKRASPFACTWLGKW